MLFSIAFSKCGRIHCDVIQMQQQILHYRLHFHFCECTMTFSLSLRHACNQGRGKVFYVGGAVGGGGCGSQFLRINITPNRNRKSCYSLRTFMRSC